MRRLVWSAVILAGLLTVLMAAAPAFGSGTVINPVYIDADRSGTCANGQVWLVPVKAGTESSYPAALCVETSTSQGTSYLSYTGHDTVTALFTPMIKGYEDTLK